MFDLLQDLQSTLAFAAVTYDELAAGGAEGESIDLRSLGAARSAFAQAFRDAGAPEVTGRAAPIEIVLGDWRAGTSAAAVVLEIERELLRIAERIYWANATEVLKQVVEEIHADAAGVVSRLGDGLGAPNELESAADLTPAETPFCGTIDVGVTSAPGHEADFYPVWYATNRAPVDHEAPARGFLGRRSVDGMRYGRCLVEVPRSHRIGSIGSNVLVRIVRGDDRMSVRRLEPMPSADFWESIDGAAAPDRDAVVFVHGYNSSFEDAALRSAQLGYDLGVKGPMAFFSWPSKGRTMGYFADGSSIEASEPDIVDFLVGMALLPSVGKVHVIAHSMGNRGVLAAITRIALEAEMMSGRRFGQFLLAAADVDADVFRRGAGAYQTVGTAATLYVSPRDRALDVSSRISDFPRAGRTPPVSIVEGIETVDVGCLDLDLLGHGYVAEAREVLEDMHRILADGRPAAERFGLEERFDDQGRRYWSFRP